MRRGLLVAASVLVVGVCLTAPSAHAVTDTEPNPTVSGPLTGGLHGHPFLGARYAVADFGYSEKEFVFSGTAKAYGVSKPNATYATRMLVEAPVDPKRFTGTVYVEWDNVTAQLDAPAEFQWLYPQILADGDAYVEVTAQQVGVCGMGLTGDPVGGVAAVCTPTSLKGFDPIRYSALHHPGDDYSYDIFSQALQAIEHPTGLAPLGVLKPSVVIAVGESQSAMFMDDYMLLGADSAARLADGFLIDADLNHEEPTTFRVPTIYLWSEDSARDVSSTSGHNHVAWSISGSAHIDYWLIQHLASIVGTEANTPPIGKAAEEAEEQAEGVYAQEGPDASVTCAGDEEYPRRYVIDAAAADLNSWVRGGESPPTVPALEFSGIGLPSTADTANVGVIFKTDAQGNALGGLREPVITVPVATYIGNACPLLGTSTPLLPSRLSALYPTHADYVAKMNAATVAAVKARFMTQRDGLDLMTRACDSAIPAWGTTAPADQPAVCLNLESVFAGHAMVNADVTSPSSSPKPAQGSTLTPQPDGNLPSTGTSPVLAIGGALALGAATVLRAGTRLKRGKQVRGP